MSSLRIAGPTLCGHFFIHDMAARIWDGKAWRGFGAAMHYSDFRSAFRAMRREARPAHSQLPVRLEYTEDQLREFRDDAEIWGEGRDA